MKNELVINSTGDEIVTALLEDKKLVELHSDKTNIRFSVGDIFLAKVKKTIPGLNAAFVDVGYEKDAFLHYLDLGPQFNCLKKFVRTQYNNKKKVPIEKMELEPDIDKEGGINDVLASSQIILVQISKEPISSKGPRLTSEITIAGRYLVIVPFTNKISVSLKIEDKEERKRLKSLIQSIKPNNFGIIVRTVAEGKMVTELHADLNDLVKRWNDAFKNFAKFTPPAKILGEVNRTSAILRDMLNTSFNSIIVNNTALYEETKSYLRTIAPEQENIVTLYNGQRPIFEQYGIDKQIKSSFGKTVTVNNGIYLIIEHTEACHVIDVNSGYRVNSNNDQETNGFQVNLDAAEEAARQLRLRDMGGIIVIDFIDMHEGNHRRDLYLRMKQEMSKDKAKHSILPPSKFGLIQITRQRVRPEVNIITHEKCPSCDGTGEVKPTILFIEELEQKLNYSINELKFKSFKLIVHPIIYSYLTRGIYSIRMKWFFQYKRWINLQSSNSNKFLEFKFTDNTGEEINF